MVAQVHKDISILAATNRNLKFEVEAPVAYASSQIYISKAAEMLVKE